MYRHTHTQARNIIVNMIIILRLYSCSQFSVLVGAHVSWSLYQHIVCFREEILHRIEALCVNVTDAIVKGEVPELSFNSRASWDVLRLVFNDQNVY